MSTCMKSQINAKDKGLPRIRDVAIANTYENKFIIPLNLEMLDSMMPYHQLGLEN